MSLKGFSNTDARLLFYYLVTRILSDVLLEGRRKKTSPVRGWFHSADIVLMKPLAKIVSCTGWLIFQNLWCRGGRDARGVVVFVKASGG